jgi:hypothetical protein
MRAVLAAGAAKKQGTKRAAFGLEGQGTAAVPHAAAPAAMQAAVAEDDCIFGTIGFDSFDSHPDHCEANTGRKRPYCNYGEWRWWSCTCASAYEPLSERAPHDL